MERFSIIFHRSTENPHSTFWCSKSVCSWYLCFQFSFSHQHWNNGPSSSDSTVNISHHLSITWILNLFVRRRNVNEKCEIQLEHILIQFHSKALFYSISISVFNSLILLSLKTIPPSTQWQSCGVLLFSAVLLSTLRQSHYSFSLSVDSLLCAGGTLPHPIFIYCL